MDKDGSYPDEELYANVYKCEKCIEKECPHRELPCFYISVTVGESKEPATQKCQHDAEWKHLRSEPFDEFDEYYME